MPLSDILLVHHDPATLKRVGRRVCYVYFSSFQHDWSGRFEDTYRFDFINTAARKGLPAILVRDQRNLWYTDTIQGPDGEGLPRDILRSLTEGFDQVVTIGASMGGFGSLLQGHLIRADLAIGIVPQLRIGVGALNDLQDTRYDETCGWVDTMPNDPDYRRLDKVLAAQPNGHTRFHIIVGESCSIDLRHAELVRDLDNVVIQRHGDMSHNEMARHCLQSGVLEEVVSRHLSRQPDPLLQDLAATRAMLVRSHLDRLRLV